MMISTGVTAKLRNDQQGLTLFPGKTFVDVGLTYIQQNSWQGLGLIPWLSGAFQLWLFILALMTVGRRQLYLAWQGSSLALTTLLSGLWYGFSRYLRPAFLIPRNSQIFRPTMRWIVAILGFTLQLFWVYGFVTWKLHV